MGCTTISFRLMDPTCGQTKPLTGPSRVLSETQTGMVIAMMWMHSSTTQMSGLMLMEMGLALTRMNVTTTRMIGGTVTATGTASRGCIPKRSQRVVRF